MPVMRASEMHDEQSWLLKEASTGTVVPPVRCAALLGALKKKRDY